MSQVLTAARIRELVEQEAAVARRLRGPKGRKPLPPPGRLPDTARGETIIDVLASHIDAATGAGTGDYIADLSRLQQLIAILQRGTPEEEIARNRKRATDRAAPGMPPELAAQFTEQMAAREQYLRSIHRSEVEAVFASLAVLEKLFPAEVPAIRMRHIPAERERRFAEANALRFAPGSEGAPSITRERVERVLAVVADLPESKKVDRFFQARGPYAFFGAAVDKVFGKRVMKEISKRGQDPETFFADLVWIRTIMMLLQGGDTITRSLAEVHALTDTTVWMNPFSSRALAKRRAAAFVKTMQSVAAILRRIDRQSEDVVRELYPEIERVFATFDRRP